MPRISASLEKDGLKLTYITKSEIFMVVAANSNWTNFNFCDPSKSIQAPVLLTSESEFSIFDYSEQLSTPVQIVSGLYSLARMVEIGTGVGFITMREFNYYFKNKKKFKLIPTNTGTSYYVIHEVTHVLNKHEKAIIEILKEAL